MLETRVIPCLLLSNGALVKTVKFKNPVYIGDPINTVQIYNQKEVDELIFLDITATPQGNRPAFDVINQIANECFMPFTYGGGIRNMEDIETVFYLGVEKVAINTYAVETPSFVTEVARRFGSQSVVIAIDVKKTLLGNYEIYINGGRKSVKRDPVSLAVQMEEMGAGEILFTSIDKDGTMEGYDIKLIKQVADAVNIPVIACGGAGGIDDFTKAVKEGGASAVAAGSMVVYQGRNRAVLINFPDRTELERRLS